MKLIQTESREECLQMSGKLIILLTRKRKEKINYL